MSSPPRKKQRRIVRRLRGFPEVSIVVHTELDNLRWAGRSFSLTARICAGALLLIFFLQPIDTIFAAETEAGPEANPSVQEEVEEVEEVTVAPELDQAGSEEEDVPQQSEEVTDVMPDDVSEVVAEEMSVATMAEAEPAQPEPTSTLETEHVSTTSTLTDDEALVPIVAIDPSDEAASPREGGGATSTDGVSDATLTSAPPATEESTSTPLSGGSAEGGQDASTSTTPLFTPSGPEATTSEPVVEEHVDTVQPDPAAVEVPASATTTVEVPLVNVQINDQNRYQFGVDDCVTVEDGFFYCTKEKPTEVTGADRFFSAVDAEGDAEIYAEKDGELIMLTDNDYDDVAPYFDGEDDRLVWHALIDDRYQIMEYDFDSGEERQLTFDAFNNMEPVARGDVLVWQAWIGNDWEIFMKQGENVSQITDNDVHDIDPAIRGDFVLWQHLTEESWVVEVYDVTSGKIETLTGIGGNSLSNPRLMLVYESLAEDGSIATMGYDLEEKIVVPIKTTSGEMPNEIPKPAHQEEEGAFVQTPPTLREKGMDGGDSGTSTVPVIDPPFDDDAADASSTPVILGEDAGTSTPQETLVIPSYDTGTTTDPVLPGEALDTLDMRGAGTSTELFEEEVLTSHIPDVVITPPTDAGETATTS